MASPFSLNRGKYNNTCFGDFSVLLIESGQKLVRIGGARQLTEKNFDHGMNLSYRAVAFGDVDMAYTIALSGGEPYAEWN